MKLHWKAGILLLLLGLPVFIWLFLKLFGQNRFEVPVYYAEGVQQAGCMDTGKPHIIPPFSLQQVVGEGKVSEMDLVNRLTVVYFFPYPCDTACQKVMEALARVQHVFESEKKVQILAINPTGTDPQQLVNLSDRYKSDTLQWKFLTGSREEIQTLMRCGFVLEERQHDASALVLIDGNRRIRGYYAGTDPAEVDRLLLEIKILLYTLQQDHA